MRGSTRRERVVPISRNRRARHDYDIEDRVEAGLVLLGTEVKSLRAGRANLSDAYVRFDGGEAWLVNAHISAYSHAGRDNHEPTRDRKLLLRRNQIRRLGRRVQERGYTLVPLALYFKGPYAKVELGLGRGRRQHDKRAAIREREDRRDMARAFRRR